MIVDQSKARGFSFCNRLRVAFAAFASRSSAGFPDKILIAANHHLQVLRLRLATNHQSDIFLRDKRSLEAGKFRRRKSSDESNLRFFVIVSSTSFSFVLVDANPRAGNRRGFAAHRPSRARLTVHGQRNGKGMFAHDAASPSCCATRLSSAPARCRLAGALVWTSPEGSRSFASTATASSIVPSASASGAAAPAPASHPRRRKQLARVIQPAAVRARRGGKPDDGVITMPARLDFGKAEPAILARDRHVDRGHDFAGS